MITEFISSTVGLSSWILFSSQRFESRHSGLSISKFLTAFVQFLWCQSVSYAFLDSCIWICFSFCSVSFFSIRNTVPADYTFAIIISISPLCFISVLLFSSSLVRMPCESVFYYSRVLPFLLCVPLSVCLYCPALVFRVSVPLQSYFLRVESIPWRSVFHAPRSVHISTVSIYLSSPAAFPHLSSGCTKWGCVPSCSRFFHICTYHAGLSFIFLVSSVYVRPVTDSLPSLPPFPPLCRGCTAAAHRSSPACAASPAVRHLSAITR